RDEVGGAAGAGLLGGVAHRPLLDARDAGRYADHHFRPDEAKGTDRAADEVAQHRLGYEIVGDYAVLHRPDDVDAAGDAADHLACGRPDRDYGVIANRQRDHGRLFDDDALALHIDEDVRRAEVNTDSFAEH